jgi:hypothetical protein
LSRPALARAVDSCNRRTSGTFFLIVLRIFVGNVRKNFCFHRLSGATLGDIKSFLRSEHFTAFSQKLNNDALQGNKVPE